MQCSADLPNRKVSIDVFSLEIWKEATTINIASCHRATNTVRVGMDGCCEVGCITQEIEKGASHPVHGSESNHTANIMTV